MKKDHTLRTGLAGAALLVFGGVSLAMVNVATDAATPPAHAVVTGHHKYVVLPKCKGIDEMQPCYHGGLQPYVIYKESKWVNVDQPIVTSNGVLVLGGLAYPVCKNDAEPGPCWFPHGITAHPEWGPTVVNGDDEELLSDLAELPPHHE